VKVAAFCLGVLLLTGGTSSAEGSRSREPDPPAQARACGHTTELQAAKRALAEGDREGALQHLRRARELVAACERDADPAPAEPEGTTPASAFAKAPTAGAVATP
jgi:hypothetical protein